MYMRYFLLPDRVTSLAFLHAYKEMRRVLTHPDGKDLSQIFLK